MTRKPAPATPAEYLLLIAPASDGETRSTVVALRTTTEFRNFEYSLNVETVLNRKSLTLTILGLSAPDLKLPATGPARFTTTFPELRGTYEVVVSKHGKASNSFVVKCSPSGVKVERMDPSRFVDIVTNAGEWEA